jgi:chitosanase
MNDKIKNKIQKILNSIETGKADGDYGCISLYKDGPNQIRQITYGKSQTTEWGNLKKLIKLYVDKNGRFAGEFTPYLPKLGVSSLVDDSNLLKLLKDASFDPIMRQSQDEFFDNEYWKPATAWFVANSFTLNLSMLVIYDSFIHSGSILKFLRDKFPEKIPLHGGDEKKWIISYVKARHEWLKNHSNPALVSSSYRTKDMLRTINEQDWNLEKPYNANGEIIS